MRESKQCGELIDDIGEFEHGTYERAFLHFGRQVSMNPIVCSRNPERMQILVSWGTLTVFLSGELVGQTSETGKGILSLG